MSDSPMDTGDQLAFKVHPRALAALGRDLVTNDVVAVVELVKNSYDAYASRVDVRFGVHPEAGAFLEIEDNGLGMSRKTIEEVWCVVATPHRKLKPKSTRKGRFRLVTGDKGLGRLSAARLGQFLEMVTKEEDGPYLKLTLDWDQVSSVEELDDGIISLKRIGSHPSIGRSGTAVRIYEPSTTWDDDLILELEENLARFVSPFSRNDEFKIFLSRPGVKKDEALEIESPQFLLKPKYAIRGHVDAVGDISAKYEFQPIRNGGARHKNLTRPWSQIYDSKKDPEKKQLKEKTSGCGPFEFEIRAWDLTSDDTLEISQRFDIGKSKIRDAIRAHKGISVYRDEILVLPKSESARDWLGLDLRRISRVGDRLSTSQIVGYVRIGKQQNPKIEDTSDRERLAANSAVFAFQVLLMEIVELLEVERDQDRRESQEQETVVDLFEDLSADDLLAEMVELAREGGSLQEALPTLKAFNTRLDTVRKAIRKRFVYYSRLATVGTIAQMLVHEIRNRTTTIGRSLRKLRDLQNESKLSSSARYLDAAEHSLSSLEELADRFAPLASRSFRRGKRSSSLRDSLGRALGLQEAELEHLGVVVGPLPEGEAELEIDPGEFDGILLNLLSNAIYWLSQQEGERRLEFRALPIDDGKRLRLCVDDSGPGILDDESERVFWPGVTRKPGGIGMGLTVASELVAEHGGRMTLVQPGHIGGATFQFDLPLRRGGRN